MTFNERSYEVKVKYLFITVVGLKNILPKLNKPAASPHNRTLENKSKKEMK